jgi:polysaccharide biosynthesis transport protein
MTLTQFLSILRARWWVVVLVIGITVVTTLAVSLILPKQYEATASVVVDFKPDPISAVMYGGAASPAFMATQVDIINSDRVAKRVVRNLRLAESPQVRAQWQEETGGQGDVETWLSELFGKQKEVTPSRAGSVIAVSYRAPDPRFAAALANAFVQAYVETVLDLRVGPARQYTTFFEGQAKDAREALETAQSRLSAFQREKGIIATDERLDIETQRLNELNSQMVALQSITAESASRQFAAQGNQGSTIQEVLNNPIVGQVKADINRGEARLQELSTRYGENHPLVVEAKANLAELRNRLEIETKRVTGGVGVTNSINRSREVQLRRELDSQRTKVLQMKSVRDEGMVIVRQVENAQRAYDALLQRFTQTNLESQTTQSNVGVLSQATVPIVPSSPKVLLNTVLSVFMGIVLALGTVLLLELMDRRVRGADDVVAMLELPVLGVMHRPGAKVVLGRSHVPLQRRLVESLPNAAKGV